jgi:hypothetical protein
MSKLREGSKGFIDRMRVQNHVLERVSDICPHCGEPYYVTLYDDGSSVSSHGPCYPGSLICQAVGDDLRVRFGFCA